MSSTEEDPFDPAPVEGKLVRYDGWGIPPGPDASLSPDAPTG